MRDGLTSKIERPTDPEPLQEFLTRYEAKLVLVSAHNAGQEIALDRERLAVGRGPGVEAAFEDDLMSRQHAVIEFAARGFRVRDLGSTNGIVLNGLLVQSADIKHGDRLEIGSQIMTVVVEERNVEPEVYELQIED